MRLRAVLPLGLLAFAALAVAQGITIKRTPKVGDKSNYSISATFTLAGMDVVLKGTTAEEITKIEDDVVTKKSVTKMTISAGGQEQTPPETTDSSSEKLDGTPVESGIGDATPKASSYRLANINQIFLPAKALAVGDTWIAEGKKDEKRETPGYKIDFKLEGEEKVGAIDSWKVTAVGSETEGDAPTRIKSTYWIEKATGRMVKTVSELTDVVFEGGAPPLTGKLEVTLQP